jgi:hypothetical protein
MARKKKKTESAKPEWVPNERERAALDAFFARVKAAARVGPRIKISEGETTQVSLDHPEQTLGAVLLSHEFGTTDVTFGMGLVEQLVAASRKNGRCNESTINFMASVIKSIKPRDELEAMLAAQMAAVHVAAMRFASHFANVETIPQQDSAERAFNKLTRTFTTQLEALKRYRTGGEQKVTVQHIDVRGGQAIVGDVSQGAAQPASARTVSKPPVLTDTKAEPMPIVSEPARSLSPVKRKSA